MHCKDLQLKQQIQAHFIVRGEYMNTIEELHESIASHALLRDECRGRLAMHIVRLADKVDLIRVINVLARIRELNV